MYNENQDVGFDASTLAQFATMLAPAEENDSHLFGSALNPNSLHHGDQGKKKEIANPMVKMEVKKNNRNPEGGGAIITEEDRKEEEQAKKAEGKDIWTEQEINIAAEERPDDRPEPEYDILHKQHVGTEDVFLGLSDRDPSSNHCDSLLVKVTLPNTKSANVQLDVKGDTNQILVV